MYTRRKDRRAREEVPVEGRIDFQERRNRRATVPSISNALEKTPLVTFYRSGDIIPRRDQSFPVLHLRTAAANRSRWNRTPRRG